MASQMFDQPGATVQRSSSARHAQSAENISAKGVQEFASPINYADDGTTSRENGNSKNKKKQNKEKKSKKKGSKKTSSSSSSSSDEEREVLVVSTRNADASRNQELGQPETTVSSWQETAVGPESVVTEVDEKGNTITRTTRTQQVKHTVQTNTYQNFTIPDDEASYGVQSVERTHEELTPRGTKAGTSPVLHTQTRTLTLSAGGEPNSNDQLGEFVSSKTLTQGNRTVETLTYKTERDGVIETHVEHRVTILSGEDIDHDAELSAAILEATQINPDMTVEKIEVKQSTTA